MAALQERIQPKFRAIGEEMTDFLTDQLEQDMYLHIAKHARRTVNAPNDTWSAYCHNKRGYKKHPHFQIGLFDDRLFVWLAFIYELPHKREIADIFLEHAEDIGDTIPDDYVISSDHMKKAATPFKRVNLDESLKRFKNVKKADLLIGKHFKASDPIVSQGDQLIEEIKDIYQVLIPIYNLSFKIM